MRILILAPTTCLPADTGARLRTFHLARELAERAQVVFLSFAKDGERGFPQQAAHLEANGFERVLSVDRGGSYRAWDLVRGSIGAVPFTVLNWNRQSMAGMLKRLVAEVEFDAVQVEGIQLAGYLPILRSAPNSPVVICDSHNIESEVMRRYSEHAAKRLRRLYARMAAPRLQYFEGRTLPKFDAHIAVSARDRAHLNAMCPDSPAFVVENGVDVKYYREPSPTFGGSAQPRDRKHRVLFVGSMDYHSNINSACQFARDVWPVVYAKSPHLTFTIVGCRPAPEVVALAGQPGIEVTGTVPDVRPYLREALVEVVPLNIGGGTRLKVLEAMAARVPVVSTPMGCEGLDVRHRREVLLAQTNSEFVRAVVELEGDANLRKRLTDAGEQFVESRHDWSQLGAQLWDFHSVLQEQRLGVEVSALAAAPGSRAWARGRVAQA